MKKLIIKNLPKFQQETYRYCKKCIYLRISINEDSKYTYELNCCANSIKYNCYLTSLTIDGANFKLSELENKIEKLKEESDELKKNIQDWLND